MRVFFCIVIVWMVLYIFLVMYREYHLIGRNIVVCDVFSSGLARLPICSLRYDTVNEQLFVQRHVASDLRLWNEVRDFLVFLDSPHWRDAVKHSVKVSSYGDLFASIDSE